MMWHKNKSQKMTGWSCEFLEFGSACLRGHFLISSNLWGQTGRSFSDCSSGGCFSGWLPMR